MLPSSPKALTPLPCLADHVQAAAQAIPDATAMVFGSRRWTYAQLRSEVSAVARWLLARGLGKGDRLVTLSRPRPEYLILMLATGRAGGIWMGLNPRYTVPERTWVLADARPSFFTFQAPHDPGETNTLAATLEAMGHLKAKVVFGGEWSGPTSLAEVLAQESAHSDWPLLAAEDPALLVYTSGSTGKPKGALISHYGLTYGSLVQAQALRVPRPVLICNLPINHVGCVADVCAVTLVQGGCLVFQEQFCAHDMLTAIEQEHVTTWVGVPSMFQMILQQPRFPTTDLSSVQLVLWGGAAMPKAVIEELRARGLRMKAAYGLTESSCHVSFTDDDASTDTLATTIGRPTPYTPCRVVDENGESCPAGTPGELQIQGRQNFLGYFGNAQATQEAFTQDRWLRSGDLAEWTADGNLRLLGRRHEMFKSGGYSVFPREIEIALESHPAVAVAAVVAVPDPLYQEVGVAFVMQRVGHDLTPGALREYLRERLANYKIPKGLHIVTELPVLPIGKIDKGRLRAHASELLVKEPAGAA